MIFPIRMHLIKASLLRKVADFLLKKFKLITTKFTYFISLTPSFMQIDVIENPDKILI